LHGSKRNDLQALEARQQATFFGELVTGIFASRDPVWPMFYALVDRASAGSLRTLCLPGRRGTRYGFSTQGDPALSEGCVYVLPGEDFVQIPGTCEWGNTARHAVQPLQRVSVQPNDFPFLSLTGRHDPSESLLATWIRQRVK